ASLGTYTIALVASQVTNTAGAAVPAGTLGTFQALTPQTFTVTTTADSTAAGTLRAAIAGANARLNTNDVIAFDSTFGGSNAARTISLTSGQLTITDPLTFTGPGATKLTIDAAGNGRAFNFDDGTGKVIN